VPVSARAATIIIDGDTIDVGGRRIGIVEIDAPETFGPRCENELILGLKAKSGFVNCPTAALFQKTSWRMGDEASD
jgi:endonuclease YncB( thermonuclease family)